MQICTSPRTDNDASIPPLSFLQAGCPSCHPTSSFLRNIFLVHMAQNLDVLLAHSCIIAMAVTSVTVLWNNNKDALMCCCNTNVLSLWLCVVCIDRSGHGVRAGAAWFCRWCGDYVLLRQWLFWWQQQLLWMWNMRTVRYTRYCSMPRAGLWNCVCVRACVYACICLSVCLSVWADRAR